MQPAPDVQNDSLARELRHLVAELAEINPGFASDADLYLDLAIPSIAAMQILVEIETRYEILVPDERFVEATSLDSLVSLVRELIADGNSQHPKPPEY